MRSRTAGPTLPAIGLIQLAASISVIAAFRSSISPVVVQPMVTVTGQLVIVFNGEIYNFGELRAELMARGRQFVTDHSDTEVLLHGFREWGADLPRRLNGMWAFVIYDRAARKPLTPAVTVRARSLCLLYRSKNRRVCF